MTSPCDLCRRGHLRSFGEHLHISERGVRVLGPCSAPDHVEDGPSATTDRFRERLAAWVERVHAPLVAEVLMAAPKDRERVLENYLDRDDEEDAA